MIRLFTGRRLSDVPLQDLIAAALLSGSHVYCYHANKPHRLLKPMPESLTLTGLFAGYESALQECARKLALGIPARQVAADNIEPILTPLERNAGQAMDPTYIAYMVQFSLGEKSPTSALDKRGES